MCFGDIIYEGIREDEHGHYILDTEFDFDEDIIFLTNNTSGKGKVGNTEYYYGFEFNPKVKPNEQSKFRTALKHKFKDESVFYNQEAERFVLEGLYRMDEMKNINDFEVVISTASTYGEETLTGLICQCIWELAKDEAKVLNIQLIKEFCENVIFDEDRAREALAKTQRYGHSESELDSAIKSLKKQFEKAKAEGGLFKMKNYKPVAGRAGFINFLKFANEYDQKLYETLLAGTEVLICEDFITSGSTVNEIIRFLNMFNPNTKISVFVLINQLRNY